MEASGFSKITLILRGAANSTISRWRLFSTKDQIRSGFFSSSIFLVIAEDQVVGHAGLFRLGLQFRIRFGHADQGDVLALQHVCEVSPDVGVHQADHGHLVGSLGRGSQGREKKKQSQFFHAGDRFVCVLSGAFVGIAFGWKLAAESS